MFLLGADENGLGPQLGPLIASAALVETESYDPERLRTVGQAVGVTDSKKASAFGKMANAEGFALALLERSGTGVADVDGLVERLCLDASSLRDPCPSGASSAQCWSRNRALPAFGGDVRKGHAQLDRLESEGVRVCWIRSGVACAGVLNAEKAEGRSKLQVDLHLFERLITEARTTIDRDLYAICGMVGGIREYARYFRIFEDARATSRKWSYEVPSVGRVAFEIKADDQHLPVAIASMVGKWLRELLMDRIVAYYRDEDPTLSRVSGYHDPSSKRFVERSKELRRRLKILDSCFFR